MTDLFEEMGFGAPRSRWDAERDDDFGDEPEVQDELDDDVWLDYEEEDDL